MSIAGVLPKSQSELSTGSTIQLSPSGDSGGTTDTAQINEALKNYPIVRLLPGKFTGSTSPTHQPMVRKCPDYRALEYPANR